MNAALLVVALAVSAPPHCANHGHVNNSALLLSVPGYSVASSANVIRYAPLGNYYSTDPNQYGQAKNASDMAAIVAELRALRAEMASYSQGGAGIKAADPLALVRQKCNSCHSGENAKAGFHTDGDMTPEDRLKAMARIMHDDPSKVMPKGEKLDANTYTKLVQQLAKYKSPAASNSPPPNPEPPVGIE